MNKTMLTDLYQLTMDAAYHDNKKDDMATFDLFIRKLPDDWGYFIANGIEDAVDYITDLRFEGDDIDYLRSQRIFNDDFLETLKDFRFTGDVYAVKEGTPIFPEEPIMRITAPRIESQFVETALLNIVNYQTMIATKANRVVNAAGDAKVVDFGLRRAQEMDAAMKGARATYIGGASATSNVLAGKEYGIPIKGTHAHSFVMSFGNEMEAFRSYVKTFPDAPTLLIDTYDTEQGAINAAKVGKELKEKGKRIGAVRLDSGDLVDLSKKVREILDERGLEDTKILASNDLNEYKIEDLRRRGARIDGYGVGTEMITAKPVAAVSGVYKIAEDAGGPKIKLSDGKKTLPGKKQVYRQTGGDGMYTHDVIALEDENMAGIPLLERIVEDGERVSVKNTLGETREYALSEMEKMPAGLKRPVATDTFPVVYTDKLRDLTDRLSQEYGHGITHEKKYKERILEYEVV